MKSILRRILVLLLVPCLVAEPSKAGSVLLSDPLHDHHFSQFRTCPHNDQALEEPQRTALYETPLFNSEISARDIAVVAGVVVENLDRPRTIDYEKMQFSMAYQHFAKATKGDPEDLSTPSAILEIYAARKVLEGFRISTNQRIKDALESALKKADTLWRDIALLIVPKYRSTVEQPLEGEDAVRQTLWEMQCLGLIEVMTLHYRTALKWDDLHIEPPTADEAGIGGSRAVGFRHDLYERWASDNELRKGMLLEDLFSFHGIMMIDEELSLTQGDRMIRALNFLIPFEVAQRLFSLPLEERTVSITIAPFDAYAYRDFSSPELLAEAAQKARSSRIAFELAVHAYMHDEDMPKDLNRVEKAAFALQEAVSVFLHNAQSEQGAEGIAQAQLVYLAFFEGILNFLGRHPAIRPGGHAELLLAARKIRNLASRLFPDQMKSFPAVAAAYGDIFKNTRLTLLPADRPLKVWKDDYLLFAGAKIADPAWDEVLRSPDSQLEMLGPVRVNRRKNLVRLRRMPIADFAKEFLRIEYGVLRPWLTGDGPFEEMKVLKRFMELRPELGLTRTLTQLDAIQINLRSLGNYSGSATLRNSIYLAKDYLHMALIRYRYWASHSIAYESKILHEYAA